VLVDLLHPAAIFDRLGKPAHKEPDLLYRHEERIIGVEATAAGYSNEFWRREIKLLVCAKQRIPFKDDPKQSLWNQPFDLQLLGSIQKAIDKKISKRYLGCDELIICIYVRATVTSESDVLDILQKLTLPPAKPHTRIFALCRTCDTSTTGLFLTRQLI
jgi:hypothetical protein